MEFRLPIPRIKSDFSISHSDRLLILGSCFTENIGQLLARSGFQTCINPFGITYNPVSIFKSVNHICKEKIYTEPELSRNGELYFSFDHHGSFSDTSPDTCLEKIHARLREAHAFFPGTTVVLITLGSAFVYEFVSTGAIVANCHKLPASAFQKRLLSKEEILAQFASIYSLFPANTRLVFTVSPVRHWKDGAVENARSKAILLTAIHEIRERYANCHYFPAYELLIDDLRDYRFYANDMLHPNDLAIAYIWERFRETYFSKDTNQVLDEWNELQQALEHRPLFPGSDSYNKFQESLAVKLSAFRERYPFIRI